MDKGFWSQFRKNTGLDKLLPNYYKWMGVIIIVVTLVFLLLFKLINPFMSAHDKLVLANVGPRVLMLGVVFIIFSKDKYENEFTGALRLKAMAFTFMLVIIVIIIQPLTDLVWKDTAMDASSMHLVLRMLVVYLLIFTLMKKIR
jgi:hypothetical protein